MMKFYAMPLVGLLLSLGCTRTPHVDTLIIGHLSPAGNDAEYHAIAMAVEACNADRARLPLGRSVRVIHAPAGTTLEEFQGQATRLTTINRTAALLGGFAQRYSDHMAPVAASEGTLFLTFGGPPMTTVPRAMCFSLGLSPEAQAQSFASYAKTNAIQNTLILTDGEALSNSYGKVVQTHLSGKVVLRQISSDADLAGIPNVFKDQQIDMCVCSCNVSRAIAWRRSLAKLAVKHWVYAGEEWQQASFSGTDEWGNGFIVASCFSREDENPSSKTFVAEFEKRSALLASTDAALAYDGLQLLVELFRRANTLDGNKLREELLKTDASFEVLSGQLHFGADLQPRRRIFLLQWDGTRWKQVGTHLPS